MRDLFIIFELIENRMHAPVLIQTVVIHGQGLLEMMHEDRGPTQNYVGQR